MSDAVSTDSDSSDVPPFIRQSQLTEAIARDLVASVTGPWDRLRFRALILAPTTEYFLYVERGEDSVKVFSGSEAKSRSRELRSVMYQPGKGTWYTMELVVTSDMAVTTRFDYDNEPAFTEPGVDPIAFATDLEKFPRDDAHRPEWLKSLLAEAN
ncbi:hypothetical protein [Agromyces sp. NPDC056965]|uniref:hypothetical protein n=1 Tax=Agromyces sp. NPDC056965 TaxID=3345983 RepID=UPI00363AEC1B